MARLISFALVIGYLWAVSRDRRNALAGAAILLPYNQVFPSLGMPLANIQTAALLGLAWALMRRPRDRATVPRAPVTLLLFALILCAAYANSFFTEVPDRYRNVVAPWDNFLNFKEAVSVMFVGWAAFKLTDDVESVRRAFYGIAIGLGGETTFCFLEFVQKAGGRVTGHMVNANATGAFLAAASAYFIGVYVNGKTIRYRWAALAGGVMAAAGAVGTQSRGGILAMGASLLVLALLRNRILFVILVVMVVTYQSWMPEHVLVRFDRAVTVDNSGDLEAADTAADRIQIWKAGLRTIPDHPLGIGFGRYPQVVPPYGLEQALNHPVKNAHNDLVLVLVEMSVLGLVALILLFFTMGRLSVRAALQDPDPTARAVAYGAAMGLFALFCASLSGDVLLRLDLSGAMWCAAGLAARRGAESKEAAREAAFMSRSRPRVPQKAVGRT